MRMTGHTAATPGEFHRLTPVSVKVHLFIRAVPTGASTVSFLGAHGEREPITGVWVQSPQRGPLSEPLVKGQGGKSPKAQRFFAFALCTT